MTGVVSLAPGSVLALEGEKDHFVFIRYRTAELVLLENQSTCERIVVDFFKLRPLVSDANHLDVDIDHEERHEDAVLKREAIREVYASGGSFKVVQEVATTHGIHQATLYRWLAAYEKTQLLTSLMRKPRRDKGQTHLPCRTEAIMRRVIRDYHMREERPSIKKSWEEVERQCRNRKLHVPSLDTFKSRLAGFPTLEMAEARGLRALARKLRLNGRSIQGADFPYALVQIDHTRVDIQLVDKQHRISIGRPWITVAIDVFSRMCVGYYISFDPPGMLGTGLCLTHAIRNKRLWMTKLGVDYDYPCQGIPRIVHADNAREFKGDTMKIVCDLHDMELKLRRIRQPQYGAHIERLMGTLMAEIHALPGTTFSNVQEKGEYDSEGRATFTLEAFERWLANLILGKYHHRPHSGIGELPPVLKYKRALLGEDSAPTGVLRVETDEETLYYDFLPAFNLSVQQYGFQLDVIQYSSNVLSRWVGARDPHSPTRPRKFVVRRDPRDISVLFFKDPETNVYHRIPYRNLENPAISVWELRRVRKHLKALGRKEVNEEVIFKAHNEMRAIEMEEEEATRKKRGRRKPKKHSAAAKAGLRRAESPQPEFGQAVPGRPQELARRPKADTPTELPTIEGLPRGPAAPAQSDPASPGISSPKPAAPKRKPRPFDEIEDF